MPLTERRFRTLEEGFDYIESFTNFERTPNNQIRSYRLDRMQRLLELFDHPDRALRCIHIAGTKGKGSTGIYLASILSAAGFKTGFYASPHVSSYTERITLAGEPFADSVYLKMINAIAARLDRLSAGTLPVRSSPTTFELLTLLGFLVFRETRCDWAVIETGIGGRLDATNVVQPELCVLTPVEREHTELLGSTLAQIAGEKAGIIKPAIPAVSGFQHPDVRAVFEQQAALKGAPIQFLAGATRSIESHLSSSGSEVAIRWSDDRNEQFNLSMLGEVQSENAALAILALRSLCRVRPEIVLEPEVIRSGLLRARLPGRMELFSLSHSSVLVRRAGIHDGLPEGGALPIVLDAAHTPVSVGRLVQSFRRIFPREAVVIFGSVAGKDPEGMAEVLVPEVATTIISTPGSFKKSNPHGVWEIFARIDPSSRLIPGPEEALAAALSTALPEGRPILVTGSFYMIAEIRELLLAAMRGGAG